MNTYNIDYSNILGEGSYGKIYSARHIKTNEIYAVKVEDKKHDMLRKEADIISTANKDNNPDYISCYGYYTTETNNYAILTMLGLSLKKIINQIKIMYIEDVVSIIPNLINQIYFFHKSGVIHRDIKPANFIYDTELNKLYLIDFGLSIRYEDINKENKKFTGTLNFMSINALKKGIPSYTDDLYSLGYMILYLCYGQLHWAHIKYDNKETRNKKMINLKSNLSNDDLTRRFCCKRLHACPYQKALRKYFNYLDCLNNNKINYDYLTNLFINILH